jgi:hypothetical protein
MKFNFKHTSAISLFVAAIFASQISNSFETMSVDYNIFGFNIIQDSNTVRWHESNHHYDLHPGSFVPSSNPNVWSYKDAFDSALAEWKDQAWFLQFWTEQEECNTYIDPNNFENVGINDVGGIITTAGGVLDECNSVSFVDLDMGCTAPAFSFVRYFNPIGRVKSHDIWFNSECNGWLTAMGNSELLGPPGGNKSFKGQASHEIGSGMHLGYEDDSVAIKNGGRNFERLMSDDIAGIDFIYTGYSDRRDLSVSTQKVNNGHLEYVNVSQVVNSDTGGVTQVTIEYTIMNLGKVPVNHAGVRFYLGSTGTLPWSYDDNPRRTLGVSYFDLGPYQWGTFTRTLNIPASVPSGDYGLWFMIDPNNVVAEHKEDNNALKFQHNVHVVNTGGVVITDNPTGK